MEKIRDFWQTLDEKQKIYALLLSIILVLCLLMLLLYLPIKMQNKTLSTQLRTQYNITQQLININKKPSNFLTIERKKAESTIHKIAKQKGLSVDLKLKDNKLTLIAKNQEFNRLQNLLLSVRNQYAITTIKAVITKTKVGFVDANLVLILP